MQKVCIITTVHFLFDDRIFYKEAVSLVQNGFSVVLIAQHARNGSYGGVQVRALPKFDNKWMRVFVAPVHAIRLLVKEKSDIHHIHDPEIYWLGIVIKMLLKKKVVLDIHENYHRIIKSRSSNRVRASASIFLYRLYEKICFSCATAIVCAVPDISNNYKNFKIKKEEIKNFPEIKPFPLKTSKTATTTFIYVGEVSEERGILEAVKAFEMVLREGYRVELKLIGPMKIDKKSIAHAIQNEHIEMTGFLNREDVFRYIRRSDVGLCLLHPKENFLNSYPVKIFEYMACGIPVIASDFDTFKNFIERNHCGFNLDPFDIRRVASTMVYFIKHPTKAKAMGANGIKMIRERYNWDIEKSKLLQLYKNL